MQLRLHVSYQAVKAFAGVRAVVGKPGRLASLPYSHYRTPIFPSAKRLAGIVENPRELFKPLPERRAAAFRAARLAGVNIF